MPRMSISPSEGETTTLRLRASIAPRPSRSTVAVSAGTDPLAVRRMIGVRLPSGSTEASRAVRSDSAVIVAPLSTSIRRSTPLIATRAQKWPSGRHRNADLAPGHLLLVEAEKARDPGEIGIVGRLLEQQEDREGDQGEREQRAQERGRHRECGTAGRAAGAPPNA